MEISGLIGFYMDYYGESEESTLNIYYAGHIVNGSMYAKSEIHEVRWFGLKELPANFAFNHAQLVLSDWSKSNGRVKSR